MSDLVANSVWLLAAFLLASRVLKLILLLVRGEREDASQVNASDPTISKRYAKVSPSPTEAAPTNSFSLVGKVSANRLALHDGFQLPRNEFCTVIEEGAVDSRMKVMSRVISNRFKCSCEGGIFPGAAFSPSLRNLGAVISMGAGQCYHKQR